METVHKALGASVYSYVTIISGFLTRDAVFQCLVEYGCDIMMYCYVHVRQAS